MALESEAPKELPFPEQLPESSILDDLQTDEQRRVLDTVAQVRICGLDSVLSLPQLVVWRSVGWKIVCPRSPHGDSLP
jgi:hypothetical protein